jgi:hypothetical protein
VNLVGPIEAEEWIKRREEIARMTATEGAVHHRLVEGLVKRLGCILKLSDLSIQRTALRE